MWQAIEGEQSRKAILLRQLFIFRNIFLSDGPIARDCTGLCRRTVLETVLGTIFSEHTN